MRTNVYLLVVTLMSLRSSEGTTTVSPTTPATTLPPTTPTPIPSNTDLAQCLCNLRVDACDVNCCCDSSCTQSDRLAFSACFDTFTPVNLKSCIDENLVFLNNTPYFDNTTTGGLFCVERDNANQNNYFDVPTVINTTQDFVQTLGIYAPPYSFQPIATQPLLYLPYNGTYYVSGDPILTVYETSLVGTLSLPAPSNGICLQSNPAAYLYDQTLTCTLVISDLSVDCTSNVWLSAKTYYTGFKVVMTPALFDIYNTNDTSSLPPLADSSLLIPIVPTSTHTCFSGGVGTSCPLQDDAGINGNICEYAVTGVKYSISYNGTDGIQYVGVTFTYLMDLNSTVTNLPQTFETLYYQEGDSSNGTSFKLSGNPGYLVGKPVMAGTLNVTNVNGVDKYAIIVSEDSSTWLTIAGGGSCDTGAVSDRIPVNFGVGLRSGCYVSVTYNNMSTLCNETQYIVYNALRGPSPSTYIARFGNTDPQDVGDWIPVLNVDDQPPQIRPGSIPGRCVDLLTGLDIQIIYANVGSRNSPQPEIIGASYNYTYQTVDFQCYGAYCQANTINQTAMGVYITSSVSFIDASQPSVAAYGQVPTTAARLPADFFYPFT